YLCSPRRSCFQTRRSSQLGVGAGPPTAACTRPLDTWATDSCSHCEAPEARSTTLMETPWALATWTTAALQVDCFPSWNTTIAPRFNSVCPLHAHTAQCGQLEWLQELRAHQAMHQGPSAVRRRHESASQIRR